uniref:SRCR domain-containing protein n=1 Tax=Stegastes partitus TaxID=144197 RepID=A0A3B5BCR2_9TELE
MVGCSELQQAHHQPRQSPPERLTKTGIFKTLFVFTGMVRLVDGQHQCEGRVEMYLNSEWGTVCDDAWDLPDAQVVCRQVGCGDATVARLEAFFGPGTGMIHLDNLKCNGAEASLQDYKMWCNGGKSLE